MSLWSMSLSRLLFALSFTSVQTETALQLSDDRKYCSDNVAQRVNLNVSSQHALNGLARESLSSRSLHDEGAGLWWFPDFPSSVNLLAWIHNGVMSSSNSMHFLSVSDEVDVFDQFVSFFWAIIQEMYMVDCHDIRYI